MTRLLMASVPNPGRSVDGLSIFTRQVLSLLESLEELEVATWYPLSPRLDSRRSRIRSAQAWLTLSSKLPGVHREGLVRELVEYARQTQSELIFANHIMTGWMIPRLPDHMRTVYIAHNAEHVSARTAASMEEGVVRVAETLEALGRRKLERRILAATDGFIALSHIDAERLGRLSAGAAVKPHAVIPPTFRPSPLPKREPSHNILLLGSFEWTAKQANARWLVTGVLPLVRQSVPEANLTIAGLKAELLTELEKVAGVQIRANPEEVDSLWSTASVCAVPERQLGGVKLKVIEAASRGVPVVSTTGGFEGTHLVPGRSVLAADDARSFAAHIVSLLKNPERATEISKNALMDMSTYPSEDEKKRRLREMLATIL